MVCNERGMALVSVVLMLTLLVLMACVLTEKVWQSTSQEADAASRDQLFWAAQAGIESARQQLSSSYSSSAGWKNFLTANTPQAYPSAPAWVSEINGLPVEIYLRDNPDGDGDMQNDNDLKIFVLARTRGRGGAEAIVESLCGFGLSTAARQEQPVPPPNSPTASLSELPVNTYNVAD